MKLNILTDTTSTTPSAPRSAGPIAFPADPARGELVRARRALWERFGARSVLSCGSDPKTVKGEKYGYLTAILYLAPAGLSGHQVCPKRSAGCEAGCLHTAGNRALLRHKEKARIARTKCLFEAPELFATVLAGELRNFHRRAARLGVRPAVRLNGTSDIAWEKKLPGIFTSYPDTRCYDYTKVAARLRPGWGLPPNYHLTFSRHEANTQEVDQVLRWGGNVAVVVGDCGISAHPRPLPRSWAGRPVVDGDLHDLRFLDPPGSVVLLRAKGEARKDKTGFVISARDARIHDEDREAA